MANENVSGELADEFEVALRAHAIQQCGRDNYRSFMVGYIFAMLKRGDYNERMLNWHMDEFANSLNG